MTHEFKTIIETAEASRKKGIASVLASVVDLDGSSYRRPGVRMLILETGDMVGAVSGGCVEKDILLQSESVFENGDAKLMTYDGRYRLGCEGVLYILIEKYDPDKGFIAVFNKALEQRNSFEVHSQYIKKEGVFPGLGSSVKFGKEQFFLSKQNDVDGQPDLSTFKQNMPPCFKMVIIGAEHDAVQLCKLAAYTGWEVSIIAGVSEAKSIKDFPGAKILHAVTPEQIPTDGIDEETAIILMTHNFANDLRYLVALKDTKPCYIGLLGPAKRRDDLMSQFMEYCPDVKLGFLENIHGPAGINIGSETPQEIAISIVSEILSIVRSQEPVSLSNKTGRIH
ncbi:XdhC family protein [Gaetbulibacter aestuarii]|uniref:XdhC family protein n=1 Tax=Gaetbulibacter aestuarii TaxID=1502358 RepID=A0ABW7N1Y7_9FLAO